MAETVECNQESLGVFNKFGIITPCWATYNLEAVGSVSIKAATIASLRGKRNPGISDYFPKGKADECD